jgi:hypothetical protein
MIAPPGSPEIAEFEELLDPVNAQSFRVFDSDTTLVNMSVWESIETLRAFAYGMHADGAHKRVMRRRAEWFVPSDAPILALWWVEAGHIPDLVEAEERLTHLRENGPTERAFTFRQSFPPPAS